MWAQYSVLCLSVHDTKYDLIFSCGPSLHVLHRPPSKQMGGVPASETRLDVKNGHVSPARRIAVRAGVGAGGTGFALDKLEESLHVRT